MGDIYCVYGGTFIDNSFFGYLNSYTTIRLSDDEIEMVTYEEEIFDCDTCLDPESIGSYSDWVSVQFTKEGVYKGYSFN